MKIFAGAERHELIEWARKHSRLWAMTIGDGPLPSDEELEP